MVLDMFDVFNKLLDRCQQQLALLVMVLGNDYQQMYLQGEGRVYGEELISLDIPAGGGRDAIVNEWQRAGVNRRFGTY